MSLYTAGHKHCQFEDGAENTEISMPKKDGFNDRPAFAPNKFDFSIKRDRIVVEDDERA